MDVDENVFIHTYVRTCVVHVCHNLNTTHCTDGPSANAMDSVQRGSL